MEKRGSIKVYIATSLDGFIADAEGKVDFLDTFPMPENDDMGYQDFMGSIDAIVMGRKSFDTVLGFGIDWPYTKPVFVWSETLTEVPAALNGKVELVRGTASLIVETLHRRGFEHLYIDGGKTIRSFLDEDLVDEMTITTIPVLLGKGIHLFGDLRKNLKFICRSSRAFESGQHQAVYSRIQDN